MIRRPKWFLLPVATAILAAGCSSVVDDEAIASVGSAELDQGVLDELLSVLPGSTPTGESDPSSGLDVRQAISIWVQGQLQDVALRTQDVEIPAETAEEVRTTLSAQLDGFDGLSESTRGFIVEFVAGEQALGEAQTTASDDFVDRYARGPQASGLACVSHILVDDEAEAEEVTASLADGADFAELAAERSADPGSAENGGELGCFDVDTLQATFVPEFAEGVLDAEIGEPTEPVRSEFGYHVILLGDGESSRADLARFETDPRFVAETTDVEVDPRYGTFDPVTGTVVGLG
ncbi:peptidylprolyl isomerase [Ilumatobacter sp.]|uniref:peptidylprolyl isomerase n=1 Tax=Ilumatobacter sp. TaxID=1967498 RepID=UPI003B521238